MHGSAEPRWLELEWLDAEGADAGNDAAVINPSSPATVVRSKRPGFLNVVVYEKLSANEYNGADPPLGYI